MFISQIVAQYNQQPEVYSRAYFMEHPTSINTGGRIIAIRAQRTFFMTLGWGQSSIQIMCSPDNPNQELLRTLHVGDVVEVAGTLTRSNHGELSIAPISVTVNSRTEHNVELRRDFEVSTNNLREVNMLRNAALFTTMVARSRMVQHLRQYLVSAEFLELETPMLHDNPSGASARTFETHCLANGHQYHLRIAPEIYLVRALMSGFNQVFELGHNFRNEGISNRHQPEFTMLECYQAFSDYQWAMSFVEDLLHNMGAAFNCPLLTQPFERLTYQEALVQYHPELGSANEALIQSRDWLIAHLAGHRDYTETSMAMLQYSVFESIDHLIQRPTFVTNHPVEISPLAQSIGTTSETERFELFVNGRELGNGFSQLIDGTEQRRRFEMQQHNHQDDMMRTDTVYMESMSHGFPRIGGFGIGIDRLVMLLTGHNDIRDVVLFPIHS